MVSVTVFLRWRRCGMRLLRQYWPWVIAVIGLVLAAAAWLAYRDIGQDTARQVKQLELARLHSLIAERQQRAGKPLSQAERVSGFYQQLIQEQAYPQVLDFIYQAAAKESLQLDAGEYVLDKLVSGQLMIYRVRFPVQGEYGAVRRFINSVLATYPTISLDDAKLKREAVADAELEAELQFSLLLRPAGGRP